MKRRGRLAAPSFFNMDDFRPSTVNAGSTSGSFLHLDPTIRVGDGPNTSTFANEFLSGHDNLSGQMSSSGSHFNYSQKNFHTSDGNLYSVFSPLQGQRSRSRPSFLRQHLQQQHQHHHQQQQQSSSTTTTSNSSEDRNQQQKWRLHIREERSSEQTPGSRYFRTEEREEEKSGFNWFDRGGHLADRINRQVHRSDSDVDSIFNKEKQKFQRRSPSPVKFHSRWPQEERLDISSLLKSKFGSSSTATASTAGLFQRQESGGHWSDLDDEDEEEEDGPLNLCLADRRRRRKSSSSSKSDLEDHHHHHHLRRRRRHQVAEDFNENRFSTYSSLFKRGFLINDDQSSQESKHVRLRRRHHEEEREVETEEDTFFNSRISKDDDSSSHVQEVEPKVLDLSMKNAKTPLSTPPRPPPLTTPQETPQLAPDPDLHKWTPSDIMDANEWLKTAPHNRKHFPRISEMLEKMHLRDDEWRQAMQIDSYRAALESTRDRLIHTHPDMFIGWPPDSDANKMDVAFQSKPNDNNQNFYKDIVVNTQPQPPQPQPQSAPTCIKQEDERQCKPTTSALPPSVLVYQPLRSCSAVTISDELLNNTPQRPLAASSSCPEVPSLTDVQNRSGKGRCAGQKSERPKGRPPRKSSMENVSTCSSSASVSPFANNISICKFKLVKGLHPVLEEKKTLHVPLPVRSSPSSSPQRQHTPIRTTADIPSSSADGSSSTFRFNVSPAPSGMTSQELTSSPRANEPMRTFKFHVDSGGGGGSGSGGGGGRKTNLMPSPSSPTSGGVNSHCRRVRKRSRKTLAREQLEATFRDQGFLIKTQQVSSAEGAVYCKFRQLKKFTRYLFKSWKDHLPLEIQGGVDGMTSSAAASNANACSISENTPAV